MLEYFSKDIIRMLKIAVVATIIVLVTGIVFQRKELYFACFIGCLVSVFNIVSLYRDCERIMYAKNKITPKVYSQFFRRFMLYGAALFVVGYVTRKYSFGRIELNMLFCGLGLLNFKISLYLCTIFKAKK